MGAATGSLLTGPAPALCRLVGVGVPSLQAGRWWTLLTGGLWCAGLVSYLATAVLLLALVAPAEARIGRMRTAALLLGTQVIGTNVGVGITALVALTVEPWSHRLAAHLTVGASTAAVGVGCSITSGGVLEPVYGFASLLAFKAKFQPEYRPL